VTVELTGEPWKDSCTLQLIAKTHSLKRDISIKQPGVNCALFRPAKITLSDTESRKETIVYFEAARGGDGDHTGPIIEVYRLNNQGFKKLGEKELFETSYQRTGEVIKSITGKVLFSFCNSCDGPDASEPADNILVPVRITLGCGGLCIKSTLTKQEREKVFAIFKERKQKSAEEYYNDAQYEKYVANIEKELRVLLAQ
jgi:hypothetical protein